MRLLFSLLISLAFSLHAQTDKELPSEGTEVIPKDSQEEQELSEHAVANPFQIGPYEDSNYQFNNPDRQPEDEEQEVNPI